MGPGWNSSKASDTVIAAGCQAMRFTNKMILLDQINDFTTREIQVTTETVRGKVPPEIKKEKTFSKVEEKIQQEI